MELLSATGNQASFRVPALGAVGDVTVVARNPGGHVGRIGLSVRFDGRTNAIVDETAAVAAPIGSGGGTIAFEGLELAIRGGGAGGDDDHDAAALTPGLALCGGAGQFFEDPNAAIERFDGRKV